MTADAEITKKVEEAAAKYDVDVKSVRRFDNTLFVEADSHVSELSYLAALWFYVLSSYEFEKVAIRHSKTSEIKEYDLYEVLGQLISAADNSDSS
jgi:hypothetical protein